MIVTIRDAYQEFVTGCGAEAPIRTADELRSLIHDCDLRYEEIGDSFWEAVGESGWAWDRAVSNDDVLDRFKPSGVKAGYVVVTTGDSAGDIYVQLPDAESRWGFCLADDDSTWDGGFGLLPNGAKWELMDDDDPRITPEVRDRLGWMLENVAYREAASGGAA